jgi:ferritin
VNQGIVDAINLQVNAELSASYSYLAMSAYCAGQNFHGFANWFRVQSQEESGHAMKLFDFLIARGWPVDLKAMPEPRVRFTSFLEVFEQALTQEQEVSRQIDALYELAFREKAFAALVELQWFITEQVEEEKTARDIIAKLRLVQDDPAALIDFDRELGTRTFTAAAPASSAD